MDKSSTENEKTVMDLLNELKTDTEFIEDQQKRERIVKSLILIMVEI